MWRNITNSLHVAFSKMFRRWPPQTHTLCCDPGGRAKKLLLRHSLYIYLCVRVCLRVTIVDTGHTLAKIKKVKNDVCTFWHLQSNGECQNYDTTISPTHTQLYKVTNATSPTGLVTLSACADTVNGWHIRNYLLLNPTKSEAIVTGMRQLIAKLDQSRRITISGTELWFRSARHSGSSE